MIETDNRTGILSLINLMPLFLGPHLDFLAGLMGLSLHNLHNIYGAAAVISLLLGAAYAMFSVFGGRWNKLAWPGYLYGIAVSLIHPSVASDTEIIRAFHP